MAERKVFSTRIDNDLIKALKHMAVDLETSVNDLLEQAIRDFLKKHENKSPKN